MATTLVSVEEYLNTSYPDGDREYVDGRIVEANVGDVDHSDVQGTIVTYFRTHYKHLIWAGPACRLRTSPAKYRVPDVLVMLGGKPKERVITEPPFIVIEIVSPDDTVDELAEKLQEYIQLGIPNIWVVNPRLRRISVHTADGERVVREGPLRTQDPLIEIPLAEIFPE